MKKYLPTIASIVLGLLFLMASLTVLLNLVPEQKFPEGSLIPKFMGLFGTTGYMTFVKIFELTGGIVVMIPRLRNIGLLLLGPVIVNIIAFHILIGDPKDLLNFKQMWLLYVIILCALYLLGKARAKFAGLLN